MMTRAEHNKMTENLLAQVLRPMIELRGQTSRVTRKRGTLPTGCYQVNFGKVYGSGATLDLSSILTYPIKI